MKPDLKDVKSFIITYLKDCQELPVLGVYPQERPAETYLVVSEGSTTPYLQQWHATTTIYVDAVLASKTQLYQASKLVKSIANLLLDDCIIYAQGASPIIAINDYVVPEVGTLTEQLSYTVEVTYLTNSHKTTKEV